MSTRNDIYKKYYDSDIFNANPNYTYNVVKKTRLRINHPTYDETKEDVFNIGKEKRIRRNLGKNNSVKMPVVSRSAAKRKNNYMKIYGSDIFNQRGATSSERRRGVKQIPNTTNKSTYLNEMGDREEYIKDLKYYTNQHRAEKKEYEPVYYANKITPQERYYREHFINHGALPEKKDFSNSQDNIEEKKLNNYIHNKIYLNKELDIYNNVGADKKGIPGQINIKEKRYFRQKPVGLYEGKKHFIDTNLYPQNSCKINKQFQMESYIFSYTDKKKDYNEEARKINERLEKEKRKNYNVNILGQSMGQPKRDSINSNRSLYGSVHSRWNRTNLDWTSPECQIIFNNTLDEGRNQSARQRKINQLTDSQNIDILTGLEKEPINNNHKSKEEKNKNNGMKRFDEIINEIPNLNEGQKLGIKMKVSSLDCNSDKEWDNKGKSLNDYYTNNYHKINKDKEVTGKVNDKRNKIDNNKKNSNFHDNSYHDYVITYSTKGNQFEKFDEIDIQKLFGAKGIQAYDIHKNPFDKGNYNTINIKLKGNDANNELYNKVKKVQEDLRKEHYKINIEKGKVKNHGIKVGKMVSNPGAKVGIMYDNMNKNYEGSTFKQMPNDIKARKGFSKQFAQINYGYKKSNF